MIVLPDIRSALPGGEDPGPVPAARPGLAAVALVLAGEEHDLSLCFIRRAAHPHDPWSGDMALPGGRADPGDSDAWSVAARETREEVGVSLARAERLGGLPEISLAARPERDLGEVHPFVCYVGETRPELHPEAGEVAAAYWIALDHLWDRANLTRVDWNAQSYTGIVYRDQVIWGLTWRVLQRFAEMLERPLPRHAADTTA